MKILVINAGSSSLKYQLIDMENEQALAKGNCENIGISGGKITHKTHDGRSYIEECHFPTHAEAFEKLTEVLTDSEHGIIRSMDEISAVGHRIVQGAEKFTDSVLVTDQVIDTIESISDLAPLHNPAHVLALRACQKVFDASVPQVVVFDTSFHSTMPPKAYMFGLPYEYYEKYAIRKYGFHGTSHRYVSQRLAQLMGKDIKDLKIVSCHLGNGSSVTAVDGGKSVDTSMGFTPLDGLIMGTRSGAVDPSALTYILEKEQMTGKEMSDLLNKKSGFLGLSGTSSDARDMVTDSHNGDAKADLVCRMIRYQVKRYIGAYAAAMGGLDAVIFTGGMGENSDELRSEICENLEFFGIRIDEEANTRLNHGGEGDISTSDSRTKVYIIPTNEELMIARDTMEIITRK